MSDHQLLNVAAHRDLPPLMPQLHLPVQSGSDRMLSAMNRRHNRADYLATIERLRTARPDMVFSSDFIVGFPGESESEYEILRDFIEAARLDAIGIFPYSDEDGTEAENFESKVEEAVIQERTETLTSLAEDLMIERAHERIGERVRVLIEDEELLEGRAAHQGPEVDSSTLIQPDSNRSEKYRVGDYVDAMVVEVAGLDLVARPL